MTTPYQKGYRFELEVRKYLREKGHDVFRSAGSHGVADLIGLYSGEITAYQLQTDAYFPPGKREALREFAHRHDIQGRLVWRENKKICFGNVL